MASQYLHQPPVVIRSKMSYVYLAIAIFGALSILAAWTMTGRTDLLVRSILPLFFAVYATWYVMYYPKVVIDVEDVVVVNPFVTHRVNYSCLIDVSTRYALTLVTAEKSYSSFAVSGSGMAHSFKAHRSESQGLPAITPQQDGAIRPSDLPSTLSGATARMIRGYWQELVEDGALEQVEPVASSVRDTRGIIIICILGGLTLIQLFTL
ncbi:hypothetical protein ACN08X_05870 [Rothia sp. P6271]|uniref:hypothetical protein n=1 Tax=unclassified Rothia (in: high G+C Gram-positive bacteria) TaxID=2689056 RepID=UPI003AD15916